MDNSHYNVQSMLFYHMPEALIFGGPSVLLPANLSTIVFCHFLPVQEDIINYLCLCYSPTALISV